MKVLIIEDEILAQDYLLKIINESGFELEVLGICSSLKSAITWLVKNKEPDLIFMDIDLGDGLCFEIFEVVHLTCPIIFTTAYDEYAIQAFKVNSIDYLLKPVAPKDLTRALSKYSLLSQQIFYPPKIEKIANVFTEKYKSRFLIKIGHHIRSLPSGQILFFVSKNKATYAWSEDGKSSLIDYSLDRLEQLMNPHHFFRINRNYLINFQSIEDIISFSGSRLKVLLRNQTKEEIIVSRDRVNDFKEWLDR